MSSLLLTIHIEPSITTWKCRLYQIETTHALLHQQHRSVLLLPHQQQGIASLLTMGDGDAVARETVTRALWRRGLPTPPTWSCSCAADPHPADSHCWPPPPPGRPRWSPPPGRPPAGEATGPLPARAGLAREVIRWLQGLGLSRPFTHVPRDFSNGFLVAEIFSWYYPCDIEMSAFNHGLSFPSKLKNWSKLENFIFKRKLNVPKEFIYATMHSKPGGAECLIQHIYTLLTNRQAKLILDDEINFTNYPYQQKLPMVARATATNAIHSNLRLTEILEQPDEFTNKQKTLDIIDLHLQLRRLAKEQNPKYYNVKPSLGERATRLPHPQYQYDCIHSGNKWNLAAASQPTASEIRSKSNVLFKEISMKQVVRNS
ncbi:spermatogenesis-associated protein 4 [Leucoraja erinacea]|uniref:spermatogenesis-associated protein 4 n=1 Tax=Leucoraja erinaceus TaxID=7782 RepID=UPI002453EACE|nr:spermatogenesis-associated protein 4 [Leucoraja erinacea]